MTMKNVKLIGPKCPDLKVTRTMMMRSEHDWNVNSNCRRPFPPPPPLHRIPKPPPPPPLHRHGPLDPILHGWKCYGNNGRNPWNATWMNPSRAGEKPVRPVPGPDTPLVDFVAGPNSSICPLPTRPLLEMNRMIQMSSTKPVLLPLPPHHQHPPRIRPTCPVPYVKRPVPKCVVPVKVPVGLLIGHNWGSEWGINSTDRVSGTNGEKKKRMPPS